MKIERQKTTESHWIDESGEKVQFNRVTRLEKQKESAAYKIAKQAKAVHDQLQALKTLCEEETMKIYEKTLKEMEADPTKRKGNFTFYNFNHDIRVKVNMNERIAFDDGYISAAKQFFDSFFEANLTVSLEGMKEMVMEAFQSRNGQLDPKQIFSILKYRSRIKNPMFQKGCEAIEAAIRRVGSKAYHQIALRTEDGDYEGIELNFSKM